MLLIYKCLCHALVLLLIEEKRRTLIKVEWNFAPIITESHGQHKIYGIRSQNEPYICFNHACLL